jgi:hypothetical protein
MALAGGWKEVGRFKTAAGQEVVLIHRGDQFCIEIEEEEEDRSMEIDLTRSEVGRLADWLDDLTTEAEG